MRRSVHSRNQERDAVRPYAAHLGKSLLPVADILYQRGYFYRFAVSDAVHLALDPCVIDKDPAVCKDSAGRYANMVVHLGYFLDAFRHKKLLDRARCRKHDSVC